MKQRIITIGLVAFGVLAAVFWFIVIPHLTRWHPSRPTLAAIAVSIAVANAAGIVYPIRNRAACSPWWMMIGVAANGLSLFVVLYAVAGLVFLEYVFRM